MIDVVERAKALYEENGYSVSLKRLDTFTGREGIVLRKLPSTFVDRSYDGYRTLDYLWQVVVRTRDPRKGQETAEALARLTDLEPLPSANGSYWFISQELYTPVEELDLDESNFYAFAFRVRTEILV